MIGIKQNIGDLPFGKLLYSWFPNAPLDLLTRLCTLCAPSLTLEMHIAALHGLKGQTPKARYHSFIQKINQKTFFGEYQALLELVEKTIDLWHGQNREFQSRLEIDLPLLEKTFGKLGSLTSIAPQAGDLHNGGRSVSILHFSSHKKIIYKPKDLRISMAFQELVQSLPFNLKPYRILCKDGYGWEEFVSHQSCKTQKEVELFFENSGILLCLLYLLRATDISCENLIASGPYPTLIDSETLFYTPPKKMKNQDRALELLRSSVLGTGMLPHFAFSRRGREGIDISGMTGQVPAVITQPWLDLNTDQVRQESFDLKHRPKNLCRFQGRDILPFDHLVSIITGFEKMFAFAKKNQSILSPIKEYPVRLVLRPTDLYMRLYKSLISPQALLNPKLRDELFDQLQIHPGWEPKTLQWIIKEEKKALLQGDIPYFYANSLDLHSSTSKLPSCLEKNPLPSLDEEELKKQIYYIKTAFSTILAKVHESNAVQKKSKSVHPLDMAKMLGEELLKRSIKNRDGSLTWIVQEPNLESNQYVLQPISESLYSGKMGIALFFAALYSMFGKAKWKEAALACIQNHTIAKEDLGGMQGIGGSIYVLWHLSHLLSDKTLALKAEELVQNIQPQTIKEDNLFDVISGSAGLLLSLLARGTSTPLITEVGDHLVNSTIEMGSGQLAWPSPFFPKPALGMSHGTAGIAYALFKLACKTKIERYATVAKKALAYERAHFSKHHSNWPRFLPKGQDFPVRWCHGSLGIGLSRLGAAKFIHDPLFEEEIRAAIKSAKEDESLQRYHLCCGLCGRVEFFQAASSFDPSLLDLSADLINQIAKESVSDYVEIGLMNGLAGIGYTLLRYHCPSLPQVLLLE